MTKRHKCITADNSDNEVPEKASEGMSVGPKAPSPILKCCTCLKGKEQFPLPELSVKASFLSAKVTINIRVTLTNINGEYSNISNLSGVASCELPASLESTDSDDSQPSHLCYVCIHVLICSVFCSCLNIKL